MTTGTPRYGPGPKTGAEAALNRKPVQWIPEHKPERTKEISDRTKIWMAAGYRLMTGRIRHALNKLSQFA